MKTIFIERKEFNFKSSGSYDNLKLCPRGMLPLDDYQEHPINPITGQNVGGEKQFGIGSDVYFFYDIINDSKPEFFLYRRQDLLDYLNSAESEYINPTQDYCNKKFLKNIFENNKEFLKTLDENVLINFYINIYTDSRYLGFNSKGDRDKYYNFIRPLLSSKTQSRSNGVYTKLVFFKYRNLINNKIYFYFKPIFMKPYSTSELASFLSDEFKNYNNDSDTLDSIINTYALKYRHQLNILSDEQIRSIINDNQCNLNGADRNYVAAKLLKAKEWLNELISKEPEIYQKEIEKYVENNEQANKAFQQIFYGAPGTGKSNTIKHDVEDAGKIHFRTTFHPDSDYSTFVGCYKPSMDNPKQNNKNDLSFDDLAEKLNQYYNDPDSSKTEGIQKFCLDYHNFIDGEFMKISIEQLVKKAGLPIDYKTEINKYVKFCNQLPERDDSKIIYTFTPQAFTNAYIEAWRTNEEVYLIIEEINRGNCAQIFGDLFQLLDRKNGFSEYPIVPDSDLGNYIAEKLADSPRTEGWRDGVKEGKKLVLPDNLYIWATMNTSDQSLFPIDSAFKRRWEWKYMPIMPHPEMNYSIEVGSAKYDWWGFLDKINNVIGDTTSSEDKKMGYFFVTPADKKVTAEQLVGKVLFYLWNDVFKNYGFDNTIFNKGDKKHFAFSDFFLLDGSPNTENVNKFLRKLDETIDKEHPFEIKKEPEETPGDESIDNEETQSEAPQAEA